MQENFRNILGAMECPADGYPPALEEINAAAAPTGSYCSP
jgi:hypothetical protein